MYLMLSLRAIEDNTAPKLYETSDLYHVRLRAIEDNTAPKLFITRPLTI